MNIITPKYIGLFNPKMLVSCIVIIYLIKRNPLKDFEICMVLENGMPVDITKKSNWDKVLNITGPNYIICYRKKVSLDKLEKIQMDNMPGFSIKWNFSHKTNPEDNDEEYIFLNDQFRR